MLVAVAVLWPIRGGLTAARVASAVALMLAGEWIRFRAVGVAGKCTRTRGTNVKELVTAGPFAHVRNPLYIGNFVLAYGLVVLSKVGWLLWAFPVAFFFQYAAIVAWEGRVLEEAFGEEYRRYRSEVRAWIPSTRPYSAPSEHVYRGEIALRSERDSLRAVALLALALLVKHLIFNGTLGAVLGRLLAPG